MVGFLRILTITSLEAVLKMRADHGTERPGMETVPGTSCQGNLNFELKFRLPWRYVLLRLRTHFFGLRLHELLNRLAQLLHFARRWRTRLRAERRGQEDARDARGPCVAGRGAFAVHPHDSRVAAIAADAEV